MEPVRTDELIVEHGGSVDKHISDATLANAMLAVT
jgi:hypothetical protein